MAEWTEVPCPVCSASMRLARSGLDGTGYWSCSRQTCLGRRDLQDPIAVAATKGLSPSQPKSKSPQATPIIRPTFERVKTSEPAVASRENHQMRNWVIGVGVALVLLIAITPDGYWYCWNSGSAVPHRTGSSTTRGDHACSHFEVWTNGNPGRPAGQ